MQDNRRNVRRFLGLGVSKSTFFAILTVAVGGMLVLSVLFGTSASTPKVSAAQSNSNDAALPEMLSFALNLHSATNYAAYAGKDLRGRGNARINGNAGANGRVTGLDGLAGNDLSPASAQVDLGSALSAISQLPCDVVDASDLGGKAFGPGVYCLTSANLAGRMTLDAGGDANARFVFRVAGSFSANDSASVDLANGARSYNAYFIADTVSVGSDSTINGNLIGSNDVSVGSDSTVYGKAISVNGNVTLDSANIVQQTGYIEICKQLAAGEAVIAPGTLFNFTVSGVTGTIQVPAGACSAPIQVTAGNVTVTEAARANTAVVNIFTTPADRLATANLGTQSATIAVVDGGVETQTVVTFVNQTTRTGVLEICKRGLDPDVTGTFRYTVQGVPGQIFTVPVGFCSGPITTTILQDRTTPFTANVTELAQPTFRLESVSTLPTTRLNGFFPDQGFDANGRPINNLNGGYANITLVAGGVNQETVINFVNRSLPGRVKVCKITADPIGIPVGTIFRFEVRGSAPVTNQDNTVTTQDVVRTVDVPAGPAAQGGFCQFVDQTFVVGTNVLVTEVGYLSGTLGPGVTPDMIRVSSVTSSTGFVAAPVTVQGITVNPNPTFTRPSMGALARGVAVQRNTTTEFAFTNFVFQPGILKVCKIAGGTIPVGTVFNFTFAPDNPAVTWPISTTPVAIQAGAAANGGACSFINGPFPAVDGYPGIGTFNAYNENGTPSSIRITEAAVAGVTVQSVVSNTGCNVTPDLTNRRATLNICQVAPGAVNVATVTNTNAPVPPPQAAARFDFDGDRKSDPVIFRPATGTWWFASSAAGGQFRAAQFGQAGDKVVAADYDGDGTTDYAVYRGDGNWYVLGSSRGLFSMNFGLATDIPQPGDFDGDGKADFAVYRPSNGGWYIMGSSVGFKAFQFGISTDAPEAADYDGDGTMDAAVYRSGVWYIMGSRDGFSAFQFGIATDKPVPADYDGDGKADAAVYRDGVWHVMRSQAGYMAYQWGVSTDTPVPADYDGDGRTDMAVYRGASNTWYITQSGSSAAGSYSQLTFGSSGDMLMSY